MEVYATKDCKDDNKNVIMSEFEQGTVVDYVTFQDKEVHAVVVLENDSIVSIDIRKLKVFNKNNTPIV